MKFGTLRWLLAVVVALHWLLGAAMGLSVDEAHYALYAAYPALSYFDHPPMVGWVQWPLVALHMPDAMLRVVPGLLWLATALGVYSLAVRLHAKTATSATPAADPQAAGLWAVLVWTLAPLAHILGIGLLPDTLLMAWTVALMHLTLTLMDPAQVRRVAPWWQLGLLLGLAGLSKYTAVLPAAAVAACLLRAHGFRLLGNPRLWLATALALLLITPVFVWNAQNHWVSFTYQSQHGAGGTWQIQHVLQFLLVQLLAYGPLLLWGVAGLGQQVGAPQRWLLLFFVIPFALLAYLSGGGTSLPHWTAPAWVALAPFAGGALAVAVQKRTQKSTRWGARYSVLALVIVQAFLCAALPALMVTGGVPFWTAKAPTSASAANPFADLHGWEQAGARARALAAQQHLGSVSVQNWTLASRLGWYARPMPVHVLEDRFTQFSLWAGDLPPGAATLLVDWSEMAYATPFGEHGFTGCQLLEVLPVQRLGRPLSEFSFYACQGWSGQPAPHLQSELAASGITR